MRNISYNPFANRKVIMKENEFVGRIKEIEEILDKIRNGKSVSIVGNRRIGKSSLLYHIFLTGNKRLDDPEGKHIKFIYLDLLAPNLINPESLIIKLLQNLEYAFDPEDVKVNPFGELEKILKEYKKRKVLPIFLFDEIDKISEREGLCNDSFFDFIQSICNAGYCQIMTTSIKTLEEITSNGNLKSTLWNLFSILNLDEFAFDETRNEAAMFLMHFWNDQLLPDDIEKTLLAAFTSTHPLVLQAVSYEVLRNRELELTQEKILELLEKELISYFRTQREAVTTWLKNNTPKTRQTIEWSFESLDKIMKTVPPISGLNTKGT